MTAGHVAAKSKPLSTLSLSSLDQSCALGPALARCADVGVHSPKVLYT